MKLVQHAAIARYRTPRKKCTKCGTRRRYASSGHCVECKRVLDAKRPGRESLRQSCESRLFFEMQYDKLYSYSRAERDYLIGWHFPYMRAYLLEEFDVRWWSGDLTLEITIPL